MSEQRPTQPPDAPAGSGGAAAPTPLWPRVRARWWVYARYIVIALPVLLFGLLVGSALYVVTHSDVFTGSAVVDRPTPEARPFGWPLRLEHRVNILLIGVDVTLDNRRQVVNVARSDTLMLLSFDPQRNRMSGLSIPRDTRAMIPGVGEMKINASFAFGGPSLTVKTVEQFLGVPVHYYVKLGPYSFARIIDAIGGVEVDVEKDMKYDDNWAGLHINLKKGRQVLNGEQAMHYIRFRKDSQGDIGRVARQQKLFLAVFNKLKSPATVFSAPALLRAFAENTQTNLSMTELITLGMFTARLDGSDLSFRTLPGDFGPVYWEPNQAQIRQALLEMMYGVTPQVLAATEIEVLNASGVPGLARQTAQRLERLGFRVVRVDTAAVPVERTTIIDRRGRAEVAQLLAELLGSRAITQQPGEGADITVLVGRDAAAQGAATAKR
ncbi:MAG TPA: LCP family protein [bacterium]|nr:LCP family protein [bacterium]